MTQSGSEGPKELLSDAGHNIVRVQCAVNGTSNCYHYTTNSFSSSERTLFLFCRKNKVFDTNTACHTLTYNINPELSIPLRVFCEYQMCHYSSKHASQMLQRETEEHTLMLMCASVRKQKHSAVLVIQRCDMIRTDRYRESTLNTNTKACTVFQLRRRPECQYCLCWLRILHQGACLSEHSTVSVRASEENSDPQRSKRHRLQFVYLTGWLSCYRAPQLGVPIITPAMTTLLIR